MQKYSVQLGTKMGLSSDMVNLIQSTGQLVVALKDIRANRRATRPKDNTHKKSLTSKGKGRSSTSKKEKTSKKQTGSYTVKHKSGKEYHGKGPESRARASGRRNERRHDDPVESIDWKSAKNDREAFKDEARRIRQGGGVDNPENYNRINSPGEKYLKEDGE